jgi:hypothetical protein
MQITTKLVSTLVLGLAVITAACGNDKKAAAKAEAPAADPAKADPAAAAKPDDKAKADEPKGGGW